MSSTEDTKGDFFRIEHLMLSSKNTRKRMEAPGRFAGERVGIVSLGCVRNTVDSEKILSDARLRGAVISPVGSASTVLVNTCAFTQEAKQESIDEILELIDLKRKGKIKKIIVHGCFSKRYEEELRRSFKEVDDFIGVAGFKENFDSGVALTPRHSAYVKISEGCANLCSYCAIPKIKGVLASRNEGSILNEIKHLESKGTVEVNIIGQDITLYGQPRSKAEGSAPLVKLLKRILKTTRIPWIRLLYLHPKRVCDDLIELIAGEKRICSYVDLPLQHINDRILRLMNRGVTKEEILRLIEKIRDRIANVALRTSFIVGFPSEADREFQELLEFMKQVRFDRLGAFRYSREEGTQAYHFKRQVSEKVKEERFCVLMSLQKKISARLQEVQVGMIVDVLVEEDRITSDGVLIGRTAKDAPQADGIVFLTSKKKLACGSIVPCRVLDAYEYDLTGELAR